MNADFPVILDACVMYQAALRDTLLRLSGKRLFLARWSDEIIEEALRNLRPKWEGKFGQQEAERRAVHLVDQLKAAFPESWVDGYKDLIPAMKNQEKDRHVLAAAVKSGSESIVTFNVRDFKSEAVEPYGIDVYTPGEFLIQMYDLNPELVTHTLHQQSAELKNPRTLAETLTTLSNQGCASFATHVSARLV